MASVQISSLICSSARSSIVSIIGCDVRGDKPDGCGRTSVGEKKWKAVEDEVANDNDDSCDPKGGKVALRSVEHEDANEEHDESEDTLESIMEVGDDKHDIFPNSVSSGPSKLAKSIIKKKLTKYIQC